MSLTSCVYATARFSVCITRCSVLAHTKKADVARVEKCTFICTQKKEDAVPEPKPGAQSKLGNWKAVAEADADLQKKFDGCMKGMQP